MKFKIDIDIDEWNAENYNFKDFIEERIIEIVSAKVSEKIFTDVYINACQKMSTKIDAFINDALRTFTNRQIVVTDRWGNKAEEYESITEMLQERFDEFMSGRVDSNGKSVKEGCSYNDKDSRIRYLIDTTAKSEINKFTKDISKTVDNRIQALLKRSLKENLTDTVFSNIDIKKLLRGF